MIVKRMESPVYHRRNRKALPGRGPEIHEGSETRSFDQYLMDAFKGEVVQKGGRFSSKVSSLTRENIIHLSNL